MSGTEIFLISAFVGGFVFTALVAMELEKNKTNIKRIEDKYLDIRERFDGMRKELDGLNNELQYQKLQPLIEEYCSIVGHKRHSLVGCNVVFYGDTVSMEITLDGLMYRCNEVAGLQYIQGKLLQVKNIRDIVGKK
jgi:hypothetical protein